MGSPLVVPEIVCSLFTSHNFDHCANSHSLYRPPGAVVFLAPSLRPERYGFAPTNLSFIYDRHKFIHYDSRIIKKLHDTLTVPRSFRLMTDKNIQHLREALLATCYLLFAICYSTIVRKRSIPLILNFELLILNFYRLLSGDVRSIK